MAAKIQDFDMGKDSDRTVRYTIEVSDGVAQDITGATFTWKLVDYYGQTPALISKASGSGITIITAASGLVDVVILKADVATLTGKYVYELRMTLAGKELPVAYGTVTILPKAG